LRNFSAGDAALWFVFSSVLALQALVGFGFGPTFARMIAYARGGLPLEAMHDLRSVPFDAGSGSLDLKTLGRLWSCMKTVFAVLSVGSIALLATAGTAAVWKSVAESSEITESWFAWSAIVLASGAAMWGTIYGSYLLGLERVALLRRIETATSLVAIFAAFSVLLAGGGILSLIVSNQLCIALGVGVMAFFCADAEDGALRRLPPWHWDAQVFRVVWPVAWKHGITSVMTTGLVQSTALIQAQFGNPAATATYAFTFRIAMMLGQMAQAPFISKLPTLARLRAEGREQEQIALLRRGMGWTHAAVVLGVFAYAIFAGPLLDLIGSKSVVFDPKLWALFALNVFFDRYTAMLQQVRNLTNRPAEHVGMLGYSSVMITVLVLTLPNLDL
jgi:O-antigen/teichoic acid export membrane protein